jgi:malate dehydrogenase
MSETKISIIGAGAVGTAAAAALARKGMGPLVLLDIEEGLPRGKALDLAQAGAITGGTDRISSATDYRETAGSRVVIITAGSPRQPGMSRRDLLKINSAVIKEVVLEVAEHSPESVLILVTNPLDLMCQVAWKVSGFPPEQVLGQAGIFDSARLRCFIAEELGISPRDVTALTLGGHGDTMVARLHAASSSCSSAS